MQITRYLFLIYFSFIPISSYAKSNFLYELISKTNIASIRSEYLQQQEEASSKEQCFEDKKRDAYASSVDYAVIVYETVIEVWNKRCESFGRYFMGRPYVRVDQDYSYLKLAELKKCESNPNIIEFTFYWEEGDGFVVYKQFLNKDLSIDKSRSIRRIPNVTWELTHNFFVDLYPKEYYAYRCS